MKIGRMYWNKRILHRYIAYAIILPLITTMFTGLFYKIARDVFGIPKEKVSFLMKIHQMSFLFNNSEVVYTALLMLMVIALVVFGYSMIYNPLFGSRTGKLTNRNRWAPQSMREYHHRYSSVIFILLLFMAITGGVYRFCRGALGLEKSSVSFLMDLHHMNFLPNWLSVIWIIFVFTALFSIAISGTRLLPIIHNLFQPSNSYQILSTNSSSSTGSSGSSSSSSNNNSSTSIAINNDNNNNSSANNNNINHNNSNIVSLNTSSDGNSGTNSIINSISIEDLSESIVIETQDAEDDDDDDEEYNENDTIRPILGNNNNNNNNPNRLESMD